MQAANDVAEIGESAADPEALRDMVQRERAAARENLKKVMKASQEKQQAEQLLEAEQKRCEELEEELEAVSEEMAYWKDEAEATAAQLEAANASARRAAAAAPPAAPQDGAEHAAQHAQQQLQQLRLQLSSLAAAREADGTRLAELQSSNARLAGRVTELEAEVEFLTEELDAFQQAEASEGAPANTPQPAPAGNGGVGLDLLGGMSISSPMTGAQCEPTASASLGAIPPGYPPNHEMVAAVRSALSVPTPCTPADASWMTSGGAASSSADAKGSEGKKKKKRMVNRPGYAREGEPEPQSAAAQLATQREAADAAEMAAAVAVAEAAEAEAAEAEAAASTVAAPTPRFTVNNPPPPPPRPDSAAPATGGGVRAQGAPGGCWGAPAAAAAADGASSAPAQDAAASGKGKGGMFDGVFGSAKRKPEAGGAPSATSGAGLSAEQLAAVNAESKRLGQQVHALFGAGRYGEALSEAEAQMELLRNAYGVGHHEFATAMNNVATLYQAVGRHAEAEPLLLEASKVQQRTLGQDHPHTIASLANLATVYAAMGQQERASAMESLVSQLKKTWEGKQRALQKKR